MCMCNFVPQEIKIEDRNGLTRAKLRENLKEHEIDTIKQDFFPSSFIEMLYQFKGYSKMM